jgi:hypothetical protein
LGVSVFFMGSDDASVFGAARHEHHPREAQVVTRRGGQPAAAIESRRGTLRRIGFLDERRIGTALGTLMNRHKTPLLGCGHVVEGVGHPEWREDALAKIRLKIHVREFLDKPPHPVDARPIHPLCPGFEKQRTCRIPPAIARPEVTHDRAGEAIAKPRRVGEEMPNTPW